MMCNPNIYNNAKNRLAVQMIIWYDDDINMIGLHSGSLCNSDASKFALQAGSMIQLVTSSISQAGVSPAHSAVKAIVMILHFT